MLALVAGTGALPGILMRRLAGTPVILCEMAGFPVEVPADVPRLRFRIETLGTLLAELRARGATRVCFAGAVRRPVIEPARIDDATLPLVPRLQAAMRQGDDGTLRAVLAIFEEAGLAVTAAHEIAPELLPPPGVLSRARPGPGQIADAARAEAVVRAMAAADVGQACVVREGQVIAVEAGPGTDWMLRSLAPAGGQGERAFAAEASASSAQGATPVAPPASGPPDPLLWAVDTASDYVAGWADWLSGPGEGAKAPGSERARAPGRAANDPETPEPEAAGALAAGGLFFKAPKPGQDRRVDLPTIGPGTVALAATAGLSALVIEAGGVLVLDLPAVVAAADRQGLVLWVREAAA